MSKILDDLKKQRVRAHLREPIPGEPPISYKDGDLLDYDETYIQFTTQTSLSVLPIETLRCLRSCHLEVIPSARPSATICCNPSPGGEILEGHGPIVAGRWARE
jgi:hypothetical protein